VSESERLTREADRLLGYGGQHRRAVRHLYEDGGDAFPRFAVDARGYELVDADGRRFVDWVGAGGPVVLGYRHPAVEEAIRDQLAVGPTLSLMHPLEVEVARALTEIVPCAEMVAFGKNGSDAVTAAVRAARAATGRDMVLQHGVHGFHDWYVAVHGVPGVPSSFGDTIRSFPYNDLEALAALFDEHPGEVAAVVMEPVNIVLPEPGYLEGVKELTHRHGALLVFDEMVTGFRIANGGAQELFGVVPDLACFGKGIANGMPLSAVVGRREHMQRVRDVAYGMTFRGETLSLAAARAVLDLLRREPVTQHLARVGASVRAAFAAACHDHGVRATLMGPDARMTFDFHYDGGFGPMQIETYFLHECARNGVLTNGNVLPSFAHDERALETTAKAFDGALRAVASRVLAGRRALAEAVGAGFAAAGTVTGNGLPAGSIDALGDDGHSLLVSGWVLLEQGPPDTVELLPAGGPASGSVRAAQVVRADVATAFPRVDRAERAGFSATLPLERFGPGDGYEFTLRALRDGTVVFACPIARGNEPAAALMPPRLDAGGTLRL
jgi:glutamate-1-semialdehyde aminotransferase